MSKLIKVTPEIYDYGKFTIMKIARRCWRITTKGYGDDFESLVNAVRFCKKEEKRHEARTQELP